MHECSDCGKQFDVKRYLTKHVQRMHSGGKMKEKMNPLNCRICDKVFPRLSHLHRHQLTHLNVREFSCPYCDYKFMQKAHLSRHLVRKHEDEVKASTSQIFSYFACQQCGSLFKTSYELKAHRTNVHKFLRCDRCRKVLNSSEEMKKHEMRCRNFRQICKTCNASFEKLADLRSHENACLRRASFQCIPCGGLFKQRVQLDRHIKKEHYRNEKCDKCGYISDSPIHKANHSVECDQKIICGYCGILNPEKTHVSETHWTKLRKPVRLEKKPSTNENLVESGSEPNEEMSCVVEESQETEVAPESEELLNDPMDDDPWIGEKDELVNPLFGQEGESLGLFGRDELEEEERFLTFEIAPGSQTIRFEFKGKLPQELSEMFPVLEETTIVLLDSVRGNGGMSVQVPVTVSSEILATNKTLLEKYSNMVIKL